MTDIQGQQPCNSADIPEGTPMDTMTVDNNTGINIRLTDNSLKDGDLESSQVTRPLTPVEIAETLANIKVGDA